MKYFDAIRQQGNRHGNVREVPGFLDASERVRQRFQREGRSEGRVHHGSSKGPRNEDLICEKCGKMTFDFKKTDRCYSCYAVRVKWNVAATSGDGICGLRWLLKDLFIEALEWYWRLFACIWIGGKWLCWRPMAFTELSGCAVSVWLDDDNEDESLKKRNLSKLTEGKFWAQIRNVKGWVQLTKLISSARFLKSHAMLIFPPVIKVKHNSASFRNY